MKYGSLFRARGKVACCEDIQLKLCGPVLVTRSPGTERGSDLMWKVTLKVGSEDCVLLSCHWDLLPQLGSSYQTSKRRGTVGLITHGSVVSWRDQEIQSRISSKRYGFCKLLNLREFLFAKGSWGLEMM